MLTDLTKVDLRLAVTDDVPPGSIPYKIRCRQAEHDDPSASMAVYAESVICFGCGFQVRRRMEALAYLLGLPSWREAVKVADKYTMESLDNYRARVKEQWAGKPVPKGLAIGYRSILNTLRLERKKWLYDRGLEEWLLNTYMIGHDLFRFTIPVFGPGDKIETIRFRNDDYFGTEDELGRPLPKYSGMRGRNGTYLYGASWLARSTLNCAFVCEGELDALRLRQEYLPSCSPTNGVRNLRLVPELLKPFSFIKHLFIVSDMDEPGGAGAEELRVAAEESGLSTTRISWDAECGKDVTEYLKNGGEQFWKSL